MARSGRMALSELGYKPTDPQWRHLAFSSYDPPHASSSASATKRPLVAKDAKDKKGKAKAPEAKPEAKPKTKTAPSKGRDVQPPIPSPGKSIANTSSAANRRAPGSGFKLLKTEDATSSSARVKPERPTPDLPPKPRQSEPAPLPRVKKLKESARGGDSDTERERSRRQSPILEKEAHGAVKRKKLIKEESDDDYDEPLSKQKRRKTGDATSVPTGRKEVPAARSKPAVKKEMSPALPPPPTPKANRPSPPPSSRASSSRPADIRARRRDISHYTSSEDEGEIPPPPKRHPPATLPAPPVTMRRNPVSVPPDVDAQKKQYKRTHNKYLGTYSKLMQHKARVNDMLQELDDTRSAVTDDDGGIYEVEELSAVLREHTAYMDELQALNKALKISSPSMFS